MKKIVIIGPECTGKSTLTKQLAAHFETVWCPEFARTFLQQHGNDYSYANLLNIAKGQLAQEDYLQQGANDFYFIDTDMHVMKIWCEVAFNNCHTWILKQIATRYYDMYLLCNVDLPWVQDGMREYPDLQMRQRLFTMYKEVLIANGCAWNIISGVEEERLEMAVEALKSSPLSPGGGSR